MTFAFSVPTPAGQLALTVEPGASLLFVGANGSGKSRLAVKIEEDLGNRAHRISAHRALTLNPNVPKISERMALLGLRTGYAHNGAQIGHRSGNRWGQQPAVRLLNDYDFLVQALFAEQANTSLETHKNARAGNGQPPQATKFERLIEIWDRLLPHRKLHITGDDIQVSIGDGADKYRADEMSDGERAIFYLIGQTLTADENSLIIFDEPELHVHRSIMGRLWDELEAARPDCGTVFISHDLEFVASREGEKFVLRDYSPNAGWTIEAVPEDTGFDEEVATLILGSRKPVLFVEGRDSSLDKAVFRACYPDWTVIPRGSCEEVIHAVVTMRANASLTRVTCSGIVDADAYDENEVALLREKGIETLPVSEIENIFLLPQVAEAIARSEGFENGELEAKLTAVYDELFNHAASEANQEPIVARYCRRRIDRTLKKIDLSEQATPAEIAKAYAVQTGALNVEEIASLAREGIKSAVENRDATALLKWYDNKGIMAIACKLKGTTKKAFEQWIVRTLRNKSSPAVSDAIRNILPEIHPV